MQQGGAQQGGILQGTGAAPQQGGVFNQFPPANVPGEQEGMRPERSLQPLSATQPSAVDEPIDPEKYILGPNDVLELHFWGVENFRVRVTVDLEGRGFVPRVGYLVLQGKTLAEGQRMLKDSVARFFPKLGFGVTLVEPRTFLVQVVDDVGRPGSYPAKAIERVATLITGPVASAGTPRAAASR